MNLRGRCCFPADDLEPCPTEIALFLMAMELLHIPATPQEPPGPDLRQQWGLRSPTTLAQTNGLSPGIQAPAQCWSHPKHKTRDLVTDAADQQQEGKPRADGQVNLI